MERAKALVKIRSDLTADFERHRGLKQEDGLAPLLFNIALECAIRQLSVDVNSLLVY
jgi:hypothetical protein